MKRQFKSLQISFKKNILKWQKKDVSLYLSLGNNSTQFQEEFKVMKTWLKLQMVEKIVQNKHFNLYFVRTFVRMCEKIPIFLYSRLHNAIILYQPLLFNKKNAKKWCTNNHNQGLNLGLDIFWSTWWTDFEVFIQVNALFLRLSVMHCFYCK